MTIPNELQDINKVDLKFVIDCTGSMTPYIDAAKQHARSEAERIAGAGDLDMQFGVVAYRDHPPEDRTFAARDYGVGSYAALERMLDPLTAEGGGDGPESVWDGVDAAIDGPWRVGADKIIILIGDSPPHGYQRAGDGFPQGCPCGRTSRELSAKLEERGITLYAHSIAGQPVTTSAFNEVAKPSGGDVTVVDRPAESIAAYAETLTVTSGMIGDARMYYAAASASPSSSMEEVSASLGWDPETANSTLAYLRERGVSTTGTDSVDASKVKASRLKNKKNRTPPTGTTDAVVFTAEHSPSEVTEAIHSEERPSITGAKSPLLE